MILVKSLHNSSVADPDPSDPNGVGPSVFGSVIQRYGYGSGFFYQQAKIVRKTLITLILSVL